MPRSVGSTHLVAAVPPVLLAGAGIVVSLWRPTAPTVAAVSTRLDELPTAVSTAIASYRGPAVAVGMVAMLVVAVVPVLVAVTPAGRRVLGRVVGVGRDRDGTGIAAVRGGLLAVVLSLAVDLAVLPLGAWAGLVHNGSWGLRTSSAGLWWRDRVLGIGVSALLAAVAGAALVLIVRRWPRTWHWHLTTIGTLAVAALTVLWPVVVEPLFVPEVPLDDPVVEAAIDDILTDAGLADLPVVVAESSTRSSLVNAAVVGLGPSRRVVLHDTLLERPLDEVAAVVAHEAAHERHRDVERAVVASAVGLLVMALVLRRVWADGRVRARLGATDVGDPRVVVAGAVVLALLTPVGQPVGFWQSRRVEAAADAASLELGADPATVVRLQRRLAIDNLSPMERPTWQVLLLRTHPSPGERIRAAVAVAERDGLPLPDVTSLEADEAADPPSWQEPSS